MCKCPGGAAHPPDGSYQVLIKPAGGESASVLEVIVCVCFSLCGGGIPAISVSWLIRAQSSVCLPRAPGKANVSFSRILFAGIYAESLRSCVFIVGMIFFFFSPPPLSVNPERFVPAGVEAPRRWMPPLITDSSVVSRKITRPLESTSTDPTSGPLPKPNILRLCEYFCPLRNLVFLGKSRYDSCQHHRKWLPQFQSRLLYFHPAWSSSHSCLPPHRHFHLETDFNNKIWPSTYWSRSASTFQELPWQFGEQKKK